MHLTLPAAGAAEEPLFVRIDRLIEVRHNGPVALLTDDAEFVRRVFLDVAGRIPSVDETNTFMADESPLKRRELIDRLLAAPEYATRMRDLFHVMLMERRGDDPTWAAFLLDAFGKNRPWNEVARDLVDPDADNETTRGSAFFITKRLEKYGQNATDYPGLARDVGRLLMGVDLQCAQCHDHPVVEEYAQRDFQGLFVVFGNTSIRRDVKFPAVSEKPLGAKLEFVSVFTAETGAVGPRLPFGMEVMIPEFKKGEEFAKPPDRKTRFPGEPKFSPLAELSQRIPNAENRLFARNAVNRLWFVMTGRGLVEPLDLHHRGNPPSHPELLDLLAADFVSHGYDVKRTLREIAFTKTYQRASVLPEGVEAPKPETFAVALERPLSAEQLLASMRIATGVGKPKDDKADAELKSKFVSAFGNAPKDPETAFAPTLKAALFVLNDETVESWLQPRDGHLIARLSENAKDADVVNSLYMHVLSRPPTDEERTAAVAYLKRRPTDRSRAFGNLTWALLASAEFCLNH